VKTELEPEYRRQHSSGSGEEIAYSVEARYNFTEPTTVGGQLFDNRWRRVHFERSVVGVPPCGRWHRKTIEHGMLGYAAAQALRWWLHALADAEIGGLCLETRIISHRISHSFKIEAVAAHGHIHGDDRSNCIPDWGSTALKDA